MKIPYGNISIFSKLRGGNGGKHGYTWLYIHYSCWFFRPKDGKVINQPKLVKPAPHLRPAHHRWCGTIWGRSGREQYTGHPKSPGPPTQKPRISGHWRSPPPLRLQDHGRQTNGALDLGSAHSASFSASFLGYKVIGTVTQQKAKYIPGIQAVLRIGWLYGTYHCLPKPVLSFEKAVVNLEPWITSGMKQNMLGVLSWCVQWHISVHFQLSGPDLLGKAPQWSPCYSAPQCSSPSTHLLSKALLAQPQLPWSPCPVWKNSDVKKRPKLLLKPHSCKKASRRTSTPGCDVRKPPKIAHITDHKKRYTPEDQRLEPGNTQLE